MTNSPRQALREIIDKHGTEVCSDARRCEGLLKDRCGSKTREINILINALKERVPLDLLAANRTTPRELLLTRLAKRLEDNLAVTAEAANWAIESWAFALGMMTEAEIAERENKRVTAKKPDSDFIPQKTEKELPQPDFHPPAAPKLQPPKSPQTKKPPPFAPLPSSPPAAINNPINIPPPLPMHPVPSGKAAAPQPNRNQTIEPPVIQAQPKKRSRGFRGCFIGCLLMLAVLATLIIGVPYAFRVMRETQQQSPAAPR